MFLTSVLDNQTVQIIFWLAIFVIALGIELATSDLVSIWFSGGSIISLILAICKLWYVWQLVAFIVVSGILLLVSKIWFKKKLSKQKEIPTNIDAMIGQEIFITKDVNPEVPGEGKVRDVVWTVVTKKESIEKGEFAIIEGVNGNKLVVKKKVGK